MSATATTVSRTTRPEYHPRRNTEFERPDAFDKPLVADIQRHSLDNGPGIRSTVFLKGCGLRCAWCHNPHLQNKRPQVVFLADRCVRCTACVAACRGSPAGGGQLDICDGCGRCATACPAGALRRIGTPIGPHELASRLLDDLPFYAASGGGVTFSGGEPAMFSDYCAQTARLLKSHSVHIAMQTSGWFSWDEFSSTLLPLLDHIYFDLKAFSGADHIRLTGRARGPVVGNLRRLAATSTPLTVTAVLVPNVNDNPKTIEALRGLALDCGAGRFETRPFHAGADSRRWTLLTAPLYRGLSRAINVGPFQRTAKA